MGKINAEQLRALVDAHGAALTLYARQWCHAPEDALQEALIELLREDPAPDHPLAWLFTTVRRRSMNLARGERRRDEAIDSQELTAMLRRLPALEHEIVVARIWGELSFEQIAALVGISTSAVHRRYRKALTLLGDMMNLNPTATGRCHEPRT